MIDIKIPWLKLIICRANRRMDFVDMFDMMEVVDVVGIVELWNCSFSFVWALIAQQSSDIFP